MIYLTYSDMEMIRLLEKIVFIFLSIALPGVIFWYDWLEWIERRGG